MLSIGLCDPTDCIPPGSSVHGILQAKILEWVAMPSSRESSWPRDWTRIACVSCTEADFLWVQSHLGSPYTGILWNSKKKVHYIVQQDRWTQKLCWVKEVKQTNRTQCMFPFIGKTKSNLSVFPLGPRWLKTRKQSCSLSPVRLGRERGVTDSIWNGAVHRLFQQTLAQRE